MTEATSSIDYWQRRGYHVCRRCNGTGEIVIWGAKVVSWPCADCEEAGRAALAERGEG